MNAKLMPVCLMAFSCLSAFVYVKGYHKEIAYETGLLEKPKMAV